VAGTFRPSKHLHSWQ